MGDENMTLGMSFLDRFGSKLLGLPVIGLVIVTLTRSLTCNYCFSISNKKTVQACEAYLAHSERLFFFLDWTSSHPHCEGPWWEQEVPCSEAGCW